MYLVCVAWSDQIQRMVCGLPCGGGGSDSSGKHADVQRSEKAVLLTFKQVETF